MDRLIWTDEQGDRLAPRLPGKVGDPSRTAANYRIVMQAVDRNLR